jgi:farnesyl-diphosphate farnesyltransferase
MSGAATVEAWSGKDRGDENFPVGSLLIRRDLRAHVHAFYAFARNADDIADSPDLAAGEKIARLDVMMVRRARCVCATASLKPA